MNHSTRKITEGAMMVAIVGLLLFLNRQLGNMLEVVMYWVMTFPVLVYTARYGVKDALLPSVSMLLLSFMIASPTTIFYLFSCIVVGLVYGGGVRRGWKNGVLLSASCLFTFLSYLITTVLFAAVFGYDPNEDIEMVKMLLDFMNVGNEVSLMKLVTLVVVLMAVLMSVLQAMCIHMLGNILLTRLRIEVHRMKNVLEIQAPRWLGYAILIIWVLFSCRSVLKLNQEAFSVFFGIYLSAKVIAIAYGVMCIMGILAMIRRRPLIFLVLIALFFPITQDIIAVFGIMDMIVNVREKMKRGVNHGSIRKF